MMKRVCWFSVLLLMACAVAGCGGTQVLDANTTLPPTAALNEQVTRAIAKNPARQKAMALPRPDPFQGPNPIDTLQRLQGKFEGPHELKSYIQKLADRLVSVSPAPTTKVRVHIADCGAFSDEAIGRGHLVFCLGTLRRLTNESELAFLVGHEASHAILAHYIDDEELSRADKAGFDEASKWGGPFGMSAHRASFTEKASALRTQLEDEADRLSIDLMSRAGFNPNGSLSFLELMDASALKRLTRQEKVAAGERKFMANAVERAGRTNSPSYAWASLINSAFTTAVNSNVDDREHVPPKQRRDVAARYIATHFAADGAKPVGQLPWTSGRPTGWASSTKYLFSALDASETARIELVQLDNAVAPRTGKVAMLQLPEDFKNKSVSLTGDTAGQYKRLAIALDATAAGAMKNHPSTRASAARAWFRLGEYQKGVANIAYLEKRSESGFQGDFTAAYLRAVAGDKPGAAPRLRGAVNALEAQTGSPLSREFYADMAIMFAMYGSESDRRAMEQSCGATIDAMAKERNWSLPKEKPREYAEAREKDCNADLVFRRSYMAGSDSDVAALFALLDKYSVPLL